MQLQVVMVLSLVVVSLEIKVVQCNLGLFFSLPIGSSFVELINATIREIDGDFG